LEPRGDDRWAWVRVKESRVGGERAGLPKFGIFGGYGAQAVAGASAGHGDIIPLTLLGGEGKACGLGVGVGATDHGRGVHPRVCGQLPWVGWLAVKIPLSPTSSRARMEKDREVGDDDRVPAGSDRKQKSSSCRDANKDRLPTGPSQLCWARSTSWPIEVEVVRLKAGLTKWAGCRCG
jgi:hypothetical protein